MNNQFKPDVHKHGIVGIRPSDPKIPPKIELIFDDLGLNLSNFTRCMNPIGELHAHGDVETFVKEFKRTGKKAQLEGIVFCPGCLQTALMVLESMTNNIKDLQEIIDKTPDDEKKNIEND